MNSTDDINRRSRSSLLLILILLVLTFMGILVYLIAFTDEDSVDAYLSNLERGEPKEGREEELVLDRYSYLNSANPKLNAFISFNQIRSLSEMIAENDELREQLEYANERNRQLCQDIVEIQELYAGSMEIIQLYILDRMQGGR